MASLNTSQGPAMSITSAPSETMNATLMGPLEGGFSGAIRVAAATCCGASAAWLMHTAHSRSAIAAAVIQSSFFELVMTVRL